jgi:hypothetical protein
VNQVALVGSITDVLELRYTQSGAALAGFTVAVSHRSKHNGEWQDVIDGFFRCTALRSVAENASRRLKEGMRVSQHLSSVSENPSLAFCIYADLIDRESASTFPHERA